jgi:ethanolamine ammonia-lyase small subunit
MNEIAAAGWAARLRALTPARVGLGRTGVSQQTGTLLAFQKAHAQARDAVHARLEATALAAALREIAGGDAMRLHSMAGDRATYLQRPDLGRRLDERSREALSEAARGPYDVCFAVVDGLSALAVERHALPLLREMLPHIAIAKWKLAPLCLVEQGRVAIGDEIGAALGAHVCVVLIGERPGLSSPDSLGVYLTWAPRLGRTDAERNCISNIRADGLSYAEAAAQLSLYLHEAFRRKLTGVALRGEALRLGRDSTC